MDHVVVGDKVTRRLRVIVARFLVANHRYPTAGVVMTAQLTNEAIDWWNNLSDEEKEQWDD